MKKNRLQVRLLSKLRSKAGESLTETLVALLIGTLALAMLASMIGSTSRIVSDTQDIMVDYYAATANLSSHTTSAATAEEGAYVSDVSKTSGQVVISSPNFVLSGDSENSPATFYSVTAGDKTLTTYERGTE